jgi:UDP-N-acetylglucosamine 2-epimerase
MQEAAVVLGNSSSGIVEAPFLGIPVLNIGDRQKGRHLCRNVIQCGRGFNEIRHSLDERLQRPKLVDTYYGDGYTASKIVSHIKAYLNEA